MKFIKANFLTFVVLILVVILLIERCSAPKPVTPQNTVTKDTVWIVKDSVVYSKPQIVERIPVPTTNFSTEYLPDTNYSKLVLQYQKLVSRFLEKNITEDSVKIDTVGYVKVRDTVGENKILGRSYSYKIKYPVIKETHTIYPPKKNQFYLGGQLSGARGDILNQINAGLLLKNKKDQIYGITTGLNRSGQITYGIQSYWKITLKK